MDKREWMKDNLKDEQIIYMYESVTLANVTPEECRVDLPEEEIVFSCYSDLMTFLTENLVEMWGIYESRGESDEWKSIVDEAREEVE